MTEPSLVERLREIREVSTRTRLQSGEPQDTVVWVVVDDATPDMLRDDVLDTTLELTPVLP